MKLNQWIEYNKRNIFLQKLCRKWGWETSSRPLLIFKKFSIWGKSIWFAAWFHYISRALNLQYSENKLHKTSNYWSRDMFNFNFPGKGLGLVFSPHFAYDILRKMFLMLYSFNWPNFIAWFPLLLNILGNICITIVYLPSCDVKKFEINLIFLINPFCYMNKKSRQKYKYLKHKKSFRGEIKSIFHQFLKDFQLPKFVSDLRVCI